MMLESRHAIMPLCFIFLVFDSMRENTPLRQERLPLPPIMMTMMTMPPLRAARSMRAEMRLENREANTATQRARRTVRAFFFFNAFPSPFSLLFSFFMLRAVDDLILSTTTTTMPYLSPFSAAISIFAVFAAFRRDARDGEKVFPLCLLIFLMPAPPRCLSPLIFAMPLYIMFSPRRARRFSFSLLMLLSLCPSFPFRRIQVRHAASRHAPLPLAPPCRHDSDDIIDLFRPLSTVHIFQIGLPFRAAGVQVRCACVSRCGKKRAKAKL